MEDGEPTSVGDLFWAVARRLRHSWRDALAPYDVTPSQLRALGTLMRHGPVRPGALAKHLGIAPRSATEVVDALEERGLVRRETDPADRRATLVVVTETGVTLAGEIQHARAQEADRVFAGLGDDDRADLERLLRLLLAQDGVITEHPRRPAPGRTAGSARSSAVSAPRRTGSD